jgi:hypothetical protein
MERMKEYQIDCEKYCGYIKIDDDGIILETMPIFRKFQGQCVQNLTKWVSTHFGYCTLKEIKK